MPKYLLKNTGLSELDFSTALQYHHKNYGFDTYYSVFDTKLGIFSGDGFAVDNSTVTATKRYRNLNVLVGPQYSFPFSKLILDVRAVAGLIKSFSTPKTQVDLEDDPTHYVLPM